LITLEKIRPVKLTKRHHMFVILKCIVSTLLYISCYTPRMMSNEPENVKRQTLCVYYFLYETIFHHTFISELIRVKRQQLRVYAHLLFSPQDAWGSCLMIDCRSTNTICMINILQQKLCWHFNNKFYFRLSLKLYPFILSLNMNWKYQCILTRNSPNFCIL